MIKQTIKLHLFLIFFSIIISFVTTYFYFDWFGHKRYFETLEKVAKKEAEIYEGIAKIEGINSLADKDIKSFEGIFEPLRCLAPAKIIMKGQPNKKIYSNIPDEKQTTTPGICLRYLYDFDNPVWIKTFPIGKYEIKFGKYDTPNWWKTYKRWIRSNPLNDLFQLFKSWLNRYTDKESAERKENVERKESAEHKENVERVVSFQRFKSWLVNHVTWFKSWMETYTVIFFIHVGFLYLLLWALCVRINEHFLSKEISPLLKDLEKLKDDFR